jgi:hypothetical protein
VRPAAVRHSGAAVAIEGASFIEYIPPPARAVVAEW